METSCKEGFEEDMKLPARKSLQAVSITDTESEEDRKMKRSPKVHIYEERILFQK